MAFMQYGILPGILVLLASAVIFTALFRRARLPPVLGYLVVGAIVGPYGLGWIPDHDTIRELAEFGVVFLMFTIGLEFSLSKMIAMKHRVFGLGGLQVLITTSVAMGLAILRGTNISAAFLIGGVVAMSSTAIVSKQLTDQLELNTEHGANAISILLFQDLAVIPFLILIPSLADKSAGFLMPLVYAMLKAGVAMLLILVLGRWILRPLFTEIAKSRSLEIFTLTVLLVAMSAAWLTQEMGLSLALGAFLAGMMLGETKFRQQIEVEIRPFRDVLLGLFFVTIGMLLDLAGLPKIWLGVTIMVVVLVLGKMLIITCLSRLTGSNLQNSLRTGLLLAQGGEFGFALLTLAINNDILGTQLSQTVLAALVFSMAMSPFIIRYNEQISKWLLPNSSKQSEQDSSARVEDSAKGLSGHVIICGFGRVGQNLANILSMEGLEYIALDLDPVIVQNARLAGERVSFGDSGNFLILKAAGIFEAKALIISFNDLHSSFKILQQVRLHLPDLPILVRTQDDSELKRLQAAGATEVIPETLEASLTLAFHTLVFVGISAARAMRQIRMIRTNRYELLNQVFPSQEVEEKYLNDPDREQLCVVSLNQEAHAVGKTISELNLNRNQVSVTALRRGGIRTSDPEPDTLLKAGDVLVLYGAVPNLQLAEQQVLEG